MTWLLALALAYPYDADNSHAHFRQRAQQAREAGYTLRSVIVERLSFREEIEALLQASKFNNLERLASRYRKTNERLFGGRPALGAFYDTLAPDHRESSGEKMEQHRERLEAWLAAHPKSVAAHVSLAKYYKQIAWLARGGRSGKYVTDEGWEGFEENNRKAYELLKKARRLKPLDVHVYAELILTARNLEEPHEDVELYFQKGLAINPDYDELHTAHANLYLRNWGGKRGDLARLADLAFEKGKAWKDVLYAKIAWLATTSNIRWFNHYYAFPWPVLRKRAETWMREYPDASYVLHSYGYFSCANADKEAARKVFDKLRHGLDDDARYVWGKNSNVFDQCKAWALGDEPLTFVNYSKKIPAEPCNDSRFVQRFKARSHECLTKAREQDPLFSVDSVQLDRFGPAYRIRVRPADKHSYGQCLALAFKRDDPTPAEGSRCQIGINPRPAP